MTDTEDEFKAMTGEGIEDSEIPTLIDDEDPIVDDDKLPADDIIDPLAPLLDDEDEEKEDDELSDREEVEAYMYQEYADRE